MSGNTKAAAKPRKHTKTQLAEFRQGYLFLTPALIVLGIFIGAPSWVWKTTCACFPTEWPAPR